MEFFDDEKIDLKENLLRGIYNYGFNNPSKIQKTCIPIILDKKDMIAQSQSGTGKTGTFTIATLQIVDENINECQAIILAPTRELAQQIHKVISSIGKYLNLEFELCVGGTSINTSRIKLKKGCQIVIGTPGRIIDMMKRKYLSTKEIKLFVIDEADELLKDTFVEQLKTIIGSIPQNTQICLFSATMPPDAIDITTNFLRNPTMVLVEKEKLSLDIIKQFYIYVQEEKWKLITLCDIYKSISINQAMIYVNTKDRAIDLQKELIDKNFTVSVIHSKIPPIERTQVMENFRKGVTRILISTDLLARGIDIEQVSVVVNYDLPRNRQHYLHRIGRSGRFGKKGVAINFVTSSDKYILRGIQNHYNINIEEMPENIKQFI